MIILVTFPNPTFQLVPILACHRLSGPAQQGLVELGFEFLLGLPLLEIADNSAQVFADGAIAFLGCLSFDELFHRVGQRYIHGGHSSILLTPTYHGWQTLPSETSPAPIPEDRLTRNRISSARRSQGRSHGGKQSLGKGARDKTGDRFGGWPGAVRAQGRRSGRPTDCDCGNDGPFVGDAI